MTGAGEDLPFHVAILPRASHAAVSPVAGLWKELVDDFVEVLFCEKMIVPVKDGRHPVLDQHLVDRHFPSGPLGLEVSLTV